MIRHRLAILSAVVAVTLASCGAPESGLLPPPSSTSSTSTVPVTQPVDRSLLRLEALPGSTTTTTPIEVGRSTLRGRVIGPDGGAAGAIVRLERLVGDAVQRRDVPADGTGTFVVANVPGGRYRVRAFLAPRLAMMQPEIFFLEDGAERTLDLRAEVFEGIAVEGSATPSSPIVGQGVNIAVRVAERAVDAEGVGREVPRGGVSVRLRTTGLQRLDDGPSDPDPDDETEGEGGSTGSSSAEVPRITGDDGVVVFEFRCGQVGSTSATVVLGSGPDAQIFPLEIPPCSPVPTTTTTTTAPEDGDPDATTTTES